MLIVQCPQCKALTPVAHAVAGPEGAGLVCTLCRYTSWLPVVGNAVALPPPPATVPVASTTAVASTAVVVASPAPLQRREFAEGALHDEASVVSPATTALPAAGALTTQQQQHIQQRMARFSDGDGAALAQDFSALLPQWGNSQAHKALLKRAAYEGKLALVGQRYRAVLDVVPGDEPAKKAQADILALAMASMANTKDIGSVERAPSKAPVIFAAVVFVLVLAGVLVAVPKLLSSLNPGATTVDTAP